MKKELHDRLIDCLGNLGDGSFTSVDALKISEITLNYVDERYRRRQVSRVELSGRRYVG